MNQNEHQTLTAGLRELAIQYPQAKVSPDMVRVYAKQLSDLPLPTVMAALERCGKTLTFFPAVAEIRKEVGHYAADASEIAESAWVEVMAEARRVGYNRPPVFSNGAFLESSGPTFSGVLVQQTVDSIGWSRICTGNVDEVRKEFIFGFRALKDRAVSHIQRGDFVKVDDVGPALDEPRLTALPPKDAA